MPFHLLSITEFRGPISNTERTMRSMLRSLVLTCTGFLAVAANATTYYVSPSGNDANNGTSTSTPWRTIDRLAQITYSVQPGDQILFERGGTYRGEIIWGTSGTASLPMVFGAYGSGALPIISGAKVVTGWSVYSGNVYRAYVGQQVDYVYVNGTRMTLARTPNAGTWYRNSVGQGTTLTSTNITQSSGYFTGARCILRSTASSIDTLRVTNHVGSTLTFSYSPINGNMGTQDWGFWLEKKLSFLDAANEWFYDPSNGYLYLWAPGSTNPSSLTVEASVYYSGINCYPSRHYATIQNLDFRYQRYAGVLNGSCDHVTVNGCAISDVYYGIRSYGSYDTYSNNTIQRTYASGCLMIDNNSVFENNTLSDIALTIGMGESGWGYFGIRGIGTGNIIRGNHFNNIGYTAIEVDANHLVEKNVISNYTYTLNDGGGINFDNANGITIQDNIVRDGIGGLDGTSTDPSNYKHFGVGIYFGNTNITNATVQRNSISNVPGTGINVDHCMNSVNNKIKYNTIFNVNVGMSISDYSNNNGPYAVAPYVVPNYNDEYTGNTIYCLNKDQLCLRFYNCYGHNYVDFGTFTNNKYYNPYDEMTIFTHNIYDAAQKYYSLEFWQTARNEETGSTRSPQRLAPYSTVSELSGNLVTNGDFTSIVSDWAGTVWPNNTQITRVTDHLDNGCLKANLPDNTVYSSMSMRSPGWFPMVNGQWYRVKVTTQSTANGEVMVGLKSQSSQADPYAMYEQQIPFGTERRDVEFYVQSNVTDNGQVRLINEYTEPLYYLDNVDVRKVTVQAIDPTTVHKLFSNDQSTAQSFTLPAGCWSDLSGVVFAGGSSFTLQPYTSAIYYRVADTACSTQTSSGTLGAKIFLGGCINWTTNIMNDGLRTAGVIPSAEPYTALGYTMENSGATVSAGVLATTGNSAPVDWVIVELKNNNGGYTVAARRACLVRRDGTVIMPDGNTVITFNSTTTVGKYLVIHHRNHIGVMSGSPLTTNGQVVDFTMNTTGVYGTDAMQVNGTRRALYSGNVNSDNQVKYTGTGNDRDPILTVVGGTTPNASISGYRREDVNMDGVTKYTGTGNDRDPILTIIGGTVPTAAKIQQVP